MATLSQSIDLLTRLIGQADGPELRRRYEIELSAYYDLREGRYEADRYPRDSERRIYDETWVRARTQRAVHGE